MDIGKMSAAYYRERYANDPEFRARKLASSSRYTKRQREQDPDFHRRKNLARRYGVTLEEYDQILDDQDGRCAICELPPTDELLQVDHDHATGKVRGLLCPTCNRGLGMFADSSRALTRAAEYVGG